MGKRMELISDTEVDESGPAIEIRKIKEKKGVALVGEIPRIHYGCWNLVNETKITGENIEEIVVRARELIEKIGQLGNFTAMGQVSIQVDFNTGNLVIKAAKPMKDKE